MVTANNHAHLSRKHSSKMPWVLSLHTPLPTITSYTLGGLSLHLSESPWGCLFRPAPLPICPNLTDVYRLFSWQKSIHPSPEFWCSWSSDLPVWSTLQQTNTNEPLAASQFSFRVSRDINAPYHFLLFQEVEEQGVENVAATCWQGVLKSEGFGIQDLECNSAYTLHNSSFSLWICSSVCTEGGRTIEPALPPSSGSKLCLLLLPMVC